MLTAPLPSSRKFTEQELRHTLDLLNSIPRPLSPTLPPSPPASPAPPSQRRRITPETDRASTPSTHNSPAPPTRRPALTPAELARIVPLYKERAKLFKRSGDSRKRGEMRSSRLGLMELTDSVLHFAYVFWAEDRQRSWRNTVYSVVEVNTWRTLEGLVSACKVGWSKDGDPAARGLYGMLILLEALVLNKMTYFHMAQIRDATKGLIIQPPAQNPSPSNSNANPNAGTTPNPNAAGTPNHPTPPSHAPSPAPTSRSPVPPVQAVQQQQQALHRPLPEYYLQNILKHSGQYLQSQVALANAHSLLNPAFMHTHFPRTHSICSNATLGALEEAAGDAGFVRTSDDGLEVDVEACVRGEGMWAWPILSGGGMAHLVGFGRSLLWEFGLTRGGYRGADGMNVDY
ncbi:hypothetical protein FRC10_002822 [Ceratobasidium sp. 414]|nr:hypothetical protein FRC10_002822 [Ceratobasidium sp. 414]